MSQCPQCKSEYGYQDRDLWICPECSHEWRSDDQAERSQIEDKIVRDSNGNELKDGDTVTIIKGLKVKGSSSALKVGTKVKNIRLVDGADGHNIACKIDGFGSMNLKSEFVKKA